MEEKKKSTKKTVKKTATKKVESKKTTKETKPKAYEPKNITILGYNNLELCTYIFDNVQNPKAVVLIVHGMQEHCLRYTPFANYLNKNGYLVVASDLRGHGRTMKSKADYGCGEQDIFSETIKDQLNILNYINENYNLPIYILGHSYGSMLTQNIIQQTPLIEKAVISGTTNGDSSAFKMGKIAIAFLSPFKNHNKRGGIEEKLCIKAFEKKFEKGNWLTRDEKVFEAYQNDEFCGGSFPFSFYESLLTNMRKTNKGIDKIGNKKLFLIAGDKDPLSGGGKEIKKLYKLYLKNNINVKMKLYKDGRHEILNEINKEEVYKDILNFFNE